MSDRSAHSLALLLRSVDYGESDRIVTLLTRDQGKLSALARGARKSRRRFAGALEPFAVLDVELGPSRGVLASLQGARMSRPFLRVLRSLDAMQTAGRAMEVLRDSLPERVPEPDIFDESVALLEHLDSGVSQGAVLLLCFEARVLALSGFALRLDHCGVCGRAARPGQAASFDPQGGHLRCRVCGGATHQLSATTRAKLNEAMARGLGEVSWTPEELREGQLAVGAFIAHRFDGRAPQT